MRVMVLWALIVVALVPVVHGCGEDARLPASESVGVVDAPASAATPVSRSVVDSAASPHEEQSSIVPPGPALPSVAATALPTRTPVATPEAGSEEGVVQAPPMDVGVFDLFSGGIGMGAASGGHISASSVEDVLEKGLRLASASPVHIAIRGTASRGSVHCEWRGVARTLAQREAAIRFWLELEDDEALPSASEVEVRFIMQLDRMRAAYPDTVISNFRSIASGGLSTEYEFLTCYVDYTVSEYVLGSGTSKVTVAYDRMGESRSYELYAEGHAVGEFGDEELMSESEYSEWRAGLVADVELVLGAVLEGREGVVFLAPMGAHNAIAVEAWQAVAQWDVQRVTTSEPDDGTSEETPSQSERQTNSVPATTVNVVRYGASAGDAEHTQTLSGLRTRIRTAVGSSSSSGGSGGVSGQVEPESPPSGGVVSGQSDSSGGTGGASGQSSSTTSSTSAPACPTESSSSASPAPSKPTPTPTRIVNVSGLRGYYQSIGAYCFIGPYPTVTATATSTPTALSGGGGASGQSGSDATATATVTATPTPMPLPTFVPSQPPAVYAPKPGSVTATASGEDRANLTWTAVTGATGYTVQHRESGDDDSDAGPWRTASGSVTGTSYSVTGLWCGKEHEFRVGAYGDGTTYNGRAGLWSAALSATMGSCTAQRPRFQSASYSFDAHTAASVGGVVGKVSAYDVNGDTVTYSITGGNSAGKFVIGGSTGEIRVAGSLGAVAVGSAYALTVGASDGVSGTTSVTANVSVVAPTCRSGVAVAEPRSNYWLVRDCEALLEMRDALRGTGALNWSDVGRDSGRCGVGL